MEGIASIYGVAQVCELRVCLITRHCLYKISVVDILASGASPTSSMCAYAAAEACLDLVVPPEATSASSMSSISDTGKDCADSCVTSGLLSTVAFLPEPVLIIDVNDAAEA